MPINDPTHASRDFVPAPKAFTTVGCQEEIPITKLLRYLQLVTKAVHRAEVQNRYKSFELMDDEASAFACFGIGYGHVSPQRSEAKPEAVRALQPKITDNDLDQVATQIDDAVASLTVASTSQSKACEDLSAVRDEISVAPPCGPTTPLESTELADKPSETTTSEPSQLAHQHQDFEATGVQGQHLGNSASSDIIPTAPDDDAPVYSISVVDADDPGNAGNQSHIDPMTRLALADENQPKHSPPVQAVAVTAAKKVKRSLHAQPDFEHVQHEFDANGLSLKTLWHQYCQSHPNKRTYEYSQFCNRFNNWVASQASTALSQGP